SISSAKLNFFNDKVFQPSFIPKTLEDVLSLAIITQADGSTANAAGLVPYYDAKEVIKTFVMVTDEEENADGKTADGFSGRFFELFMKYREQIYPAKLVFISFLSHQHAEGQMYSQFKNANVPDVLQFKFNRERPDLTKIDNLIGLLSTGSSASFDNNLEPLQAEFQANGVESVITRLIGTQDENSAPMDVQMETSAQLHALSAGFKGYASSVTYLQMPLWSLTTYMNLNDYYRLFENSCLGRYDGEVYEALMERARLNPSNRHRVHPVWLSVKQGTLCKL
ncbi:unnamed protein product, partial [Adineta steineri]